MVIAHTAQEEMSGGLGDGRGAGVVREDGGRKLSSSQDEPGLPWA